MAASRAPRALALGMWLLGSVRCLENGLARTPPMGWRSWNLFGEHISQLSMERIMDGMVARRRQVGGVPTSLCDLGYCDVGLDDNWQRCGAGADGYVYHSSDGSPIVNRTTFPDFAAMTAHAHRLGLRAGWYANNCICAEKKKATYQMYKQDVHFMTKVWNFDSVKLDGCGTMKDLNLWARLIAESGRPMVIENCHWGLTLPTKDWCPWSFFRTSGDIRAIYGSVVSNLQTTVQFARQGLSRPGCWAYPDMLEVGCEHGPGGSMDRGLSLDEAYSHFGAWCITSSPLTLSLDVNKDEVMDKVWPIISNKEAIEVNQAWAGHSGSPFKESWEIINLESADFIGKPLTLTPITIQAPRWQFFYKPLGEGRVAVLMMNHGSWSDTLRLSMVDVPQLACQSCLVRDVWAQRDLLDGQATPEYAALIPSHGTAFLVLSPSHPVVIS